jgi:hypothetical protein
MARLPVRAASVAAVPAITARQQAARQSHLEARAKDNHLVIQPIDFFLVEPILSNLHPGAEGPACAQFFDSITDGLSPELARF